MTAPHDRPPFQLDRKFQTFTTKVSVSDSVNDPKGGPRAPLVFTLYGDGKQLWQFKNVMTAADIQEKTIDVRDVNILKLEVTLRGDDVGGAHGAWIEPYLIRR